MLDVRGHTVTPGRNISREAPHGQVERGIWPSGSWRGVRGRARVGSVAGMWREQQRHDMGRVESGVDEMKFFQMLFVFLPDDKSNSCCCLNF